MTKRASFDFDFTLSDPMVQSIAKGLIEKGWEVWCVTSRFDYHPTQKYQCDNSDLHKVCDKVGIKPYHRVFTGMNPKIEFLATIDFVFHLDDDEIECGLITENSELIVIHKDDNGDFQSKLTILVDAFEYGHDMFKKIRFE